MTSGTVWRDRAKYLTSAERVNQLVHLDEIAPRVVWRAVRDAGKAGITREALDAQVIDKLCASRTAWAISELRRRHFISARFPDGIHRGSQMHYVVDMDCKVPVNESAELGPGFEYEMAVLRRQAGNGAELPKEA